MNWHNKKGNSEQNRKKGRKKKIAYIEIFSDDGKDTEDFSADTNAVELDLPSWKWIRQPEQQNYKLVNRYIVWWQGKPIYEELHLGPWFS